MLEAQAGGGALRGGLAGVRGDAEEGAGFFPPHAQCDMSRLGLFAGLSGRGWGGNHAGLLQ